MPLIGPDPEDEQQWVDTALQQNLSVMSSQLGAEIARDEVRIARGGHYPTLNFFASYGNSTQDGDALTTPPLRETVVDTDRDTTQFGVNFSLPIYAGGGVSSAVEHG